ncbi:MAG: glycosyltransferase, partial [Candidatus Lokiarchaeota archaeon]|nr:glycosyltransferase [Candidatus Lokiarchaeota archaeon]
MNIALIASHFLSKRGGITTTINNFREKMTALGETVLVYNTDIEKNNYIKSIEWGQSLKDLIHKKGGFYLFIIELFIGIVSFKGIKFKEKLILAFYYCFFPRNLVNRVGSLKKLISDFRKKKLDIILSISSTYPLFLGFILSKWYKIPLVTLAHGEDFLRRYPHNLNTILFHHSNKIILSNSIMKELFLKVHEVEKEKVKIIYRGVNLESIKVDMDKQKLREKHKIDQRDFIILTVSRIYFRKGIDTIIRTVSNIIEENQHLLFKYYIIGEGKEKKRLENLVKELNLEKYVYFLGAKDNKIRNEYYKLSDLFILVPEIKKNSIEGFGIVYIEANYFNLPVIGSRSGGVKIAIEDEKSGYLVEPSN